MNKLPKGIDKLPTGVEVRGDAVRISFTYEGMRCREPITGHSKLSKAVILYADNKRRTIVTEIKDGRFDYVKHFPESERAKLFSGYGGKDSRRTVDDGVKKWLAVQEATKAKSTFTNYRKKSRRVVEYFGKRKMRDIAKSEMELYQAVLLREGLSPKTVNDIFTIIRGVWADAFSDSAIEHNIMERIKNVERDALDETADPFDREEMARIGATNSLQPENINMLMFWCWSGLSYSEIIALAWEDIDTVKWTAKINRARVLGDYKVPKERSRVRVIELLDPAIRYLKQQMQYTAMLPAKEFAVKNRDNITKRSDKIRLVFMNGDMPWSQSTYRTWFEPHLRKAKVRHRGPNQCRHTFASQLLTSYVPMEWIARQLGHSDTTMIKKHYGKWIPKDSKRQADLISQMLGVVEKEEKSELGRTGKA
ncbi:DUF3596 domain-containing protein [Alishewanella sp. 16-MA]|uniref:DUF3596 domain-containing protein n=2 Tax=Gammaproteobacteria TaxID=1236 RepID=A0ABS8C1P1_9ALTE|nr:DUF3596 domain-containing protein [Alishewanella maricola]MCB5226247.1 DUF3596 domain-containing protein [Alishewanella maricola]